MKEHKLHDVAHSSDSEIDLYCKIEEKLVQEGRIDVSEKEMERELSNLRDFHNMRYHLHLHYYTFTIGLLFSYFSYAEYNIGREFSWPSTLFAVGAIAFFVITYLIYHPVYKHSKEVQKYYNKHWKELPGAKDRHHMTPKEVISFCKGLPNNMYRIVMYPLAEEEKDRTNDRREKIDKSKIS